MHHYTKDENFDNKELEKDTRIIYCKLTKGISILGAYYSKEILIFLNIDSIYDTELIRNISSEVRASKVTIVR